MHMLASGIDVTTIALWLGHESPASTRHYLHADLGIKQRALDRTAPPRTRPGRYKPTDKILAFLEEPVIMPNSARPPPLRARGSPASSA